ncbi:MAG: GNAT family N-acetyltransferase [Calditrichaeota bacterium]|nr:GNAT family N-acetyltransferase [Calditrichota bacterium]
MELNNHIYLREIRSLDEFYKLEAGWKALGDKCEYYNPFLSYDWFKCILETYLKDKELMILACYSGDKVLAIAPFWRYDSRMYKIKFKNIEFITCPDTPFVDFIIKSGYREACIEAFFDYLYTDLRISWDFLNIKQFPETSPHYALLKSFLDRENKRYYTQVSSITPVIKIEEEWETFLQGRSRKFRKTRNNIRNRLNKLEKVDVICHRHDDKKYLFDNILEVSRAGWKHDEGKGLSSKSETVSFFEKLTRAASLQNWLRIWLLIQDDNPIAMEYDLTYKGKVYALRADYNEKYGEFSPGTYLEYEIIQYYFQNGYLAYSTGPGLNEYKMHWTDHSFKNVNLHICSSWKAKINWYIEIYFKSRTSKYKSRLKELLNKK